MTTTFGTIDILPVNIPMEEILRNFLLSRNIDANNVATMCAEKVYLNGKKVHANTEKTALLLAGRAVVKCENDNV